MTVTQIGVRGTRRLSLPLTAKDQADLDLIRSTPERLGSLPGNIDASSSDAALVHAVFEAGLAQIREAAEIAGYAALANDPEYQSYHAARRAAGGRRRA